MPIYEYRCKKCGHTFEELVFGDELPSCPSCHTAETEKMLSRCCCHFGGASEGGELPSAPAPSGGGCAGCSGGNCASCGH